MAFDPSLNYYGGQEDSQEDLWLDDLKALLDEPDTAARSGGYNSAAQSGSRTSAHQTYSQPAPQKAAAQNPYYQPAPQKAAAQNPYYQPAPQKAAAQNPYYQPAPQKAAAQNPYYQPAPQKAAAQNPYYQPAPQKAAAQNPYYQPVPEKAAAGAQPRQSGFHPDFQNLNLNPNPGAGQSGGFQSAPDFRTPSQQRGAPSQSQAWQMMSGSRVSQQPSWQPDSGYRMPGSQLADEKPRKKGYTSIIILSILVCLEAAAIAAVAIHWVQWMG